MQGKDRSGHRRRTARRRYLTSAAAVGLAAVAATAAMAASTIGPGITTPTKLAPFKPSNKVGVKPKLPKVIGFAQDSPRGFEQLLLAGLQAGAKARGLTVNVANSNGDPQQQVQNMQQFLITGVAAIVTGPIDQAGQTPVQLSAMNDGVDMDEIVAGPATSQVNANQYAGGHALGEIAARYIKTKLGGKANVVILNQDSVPPIQPRFKAVRDVMKTLPGVTIVSDIQPATTDNQGGFSTMNTILQKTPHVDVVLGADAVVEGALQALQADHQASPKQFLAGMDCESQALAYIEQAGPYKGCVGLSAGIFGYAWAQFAADWLAGKSIPQGIDIAPYTVTGVATARAYARVDANPGLVWSNKKMLSKYLRFYGNISYATRSHYLAYSWNPGA